MKNSITHDFSKKNIHQSDNASSKSCQNNSLAPAHKTLQIVQLVSLWTINYLNVCIICILCNEQSTHTYI